MAMISMGLTGSFVTSRVREMALEGNYQGALEVLGEMEGLTLAQTQQILAGTLRLVGNNVFQVEPEEQGVQEAWQALWQETVSDMAYMPETQEYLRVLAIRDLQDPGPSVVESEFLIRQNCVSSLNQLSNSAQELRQLTAEIYCSASDLKVVEIDGFWVYCVPKTEASLFPWQRDWLRERICPVMQILDDGLALDLRTPERRKRLVPGLAWIDAGMWSSPLVGEPTEDVDVAQVAWTQGRVLTQFSETEEVDVAALRQQICAAADADEAGWLVVPYVDSNGLQKDIRIPRKPLVSLAYRQACLPDATGYVPLSPRGLKMPNDDAAHTDAWLGTGMDLALAYEMQQPEVWAFYDALFDLQKDLLSLKDFAILNRGGSDFVRGYVTTPENIFKLKKTHPDERFVLVVPHAGVEYDLAAREACAVITGAGGRLAHLVTVSRERDVPIIRVENALTAVLADRYLSIDLKEGTLTLGATRVSLS